MYPQFGPEPTGATPIAPSQAPYPYPYPPPPPPPPPSSRWARRRAVVAVGTTAALVVAAAVGLDAATASNSTVAGSGSVALLPTPSSPTTPGGSVPGGVEPGGGSSGDGSGSTSPSGPHQVSQAAASAAQQIGVVDINTVLGYQSAAAAGTGMILTSTGEILTNNHVVSGATRIRVTVVSTGVSYPATVVGTDPTQDVAVLQLRNASGLQPANLGDSSTVQVNDSVTGVGNAGGVGGTPSAATGTVVALGRTITASDQSGGSSETLHGMIETNAPIQSGDSGGPLYSAAGKIIGMDTAASTNGQPALGQATSVQVATTAFAIPINTALSVARQIESGVATSTVHIGYPAFLGVSVETAATAPGAVIASVLNGGPAALAGVTPGDLITAVDGRSVASGTALRTALSRYRPGDTVSISWTAADGSSHTASATLIAGPPD